MHISRSARAHRDRGKPLTLCPPNYSTAGKRSASTAVIRRLGTHVVPALFFIRCNTQVFAHPSPIESRDVELSIDSGLSCVPVRSMPSTEQGRRQET